MNFTSRTTRIRSVAAGLALFAAASAAHAQVYKCTDANGRTSYADAPCGTAGSKLALPEDGRRGAGNRTVCAQLLDERARLASEAKRQPKKSGTLERQQRRVADAYAHRCAAIGR